MVDNGLEIIEQVIESASKWPKIAKECGVPKQMIDSILPEMKLSI